MEMDGFNNPMSSEAGASSEQITMTMEEIREHEEQVNATFRRIEKERDQAMTLLGKVVAAAGEAVAHIQKECDAQPGSWLSVQAALDKLRRALER